MESRQSPAREGVHVASRTNLYFAVGTLNLLYICCGCVAAWTSPTLPKLKDVITKDQASWVGSLYSLGAAFGPIITALCLNTIGRKATLYILSACFLISWIILGSSTEVHVLYVGRMIAGLGVGGAFASTSGYIAEIADVDSRGAMNSISITLLAVGELLEFCIGPYTSYMTLIIVSVIPAILFIILFFFIKESPYYLLLKNRKAEALESLIWYRGGIQADIAEKELTEIQENLELGKEKRVGFKAFLQRGPMKALLISFYLLILQQGCGSNAITSFAETIFDMGHVAVSAPICAMIGGGTIFLAGIFTPFIVNKFSMKKAFLVSTYGVSIMLCVLAIYFYLESNGHNVTNIAFLPVLAYILYNVFICWGCGPIPWAIVAELFPLEIKGLAFCVSGIVSSLAGFATIQVAGIVLNSAGPTIVFASFGIFLLITITGAIFFVPDTTGLTLEQVQEYLTSGKRPKITKENS